MDIYREGKYILSD